MIVLRFDGLYRCLSNDSGENGNSSVRSPGSRPPGAPISKPGLLCYGWLITRKGVAVAQGHGAFTRGRNASSNVAEYLALIEGLDALIDLGIGSEPVEVRGDAKSIIDQMRGAAEVNAASIRPYFKRAGQLVSKLHRVDWIWMPRKNNREADTLSRRAMRQLRRDRSYYLNAVQFVTSHPRRERLTPVLDLRVYF